MKAGNINVGEYIVFKRTGQRIKVQQDVMQDNCHEAITYLRMRADDYRKPTIADLKEGDAFWWTGHVPYTVVEASADKVTVKYRLHNGNKFIENTFTVFPDKFKEYIHIISLASEKVGPERKTATVWFNVYPRGEMSEPYATKEHAGSEAGPGREACIEVPITWTKGEGLGE